MMALKYCLEKLKEEVNELDTRYTPDELRKIAKQREDYFNRARNL